MNTIQQEQRAKTEALGQDVLKQMRDMSKGRAVETSKAAYRSIRSTLADRQLECLYEFKHAGSAGMTARTLSEIVGTGLNCISGRVSELKKIGAIEPTGLIHERSKLNRITRKGINILQAR